VREAVEAHYKFLRHLERAIDKKFSYWNWYPEQDEDDANTTFWERHGLDNHFKKLRFCLTLAAFSGVSASDIEHPSRQTEALTFVCEMSAQHFANRPHLSVVDSAKQLMYAQYSEAAPAPVVPDLQGQVDAKFADNATLLASLLEPLEAVQVFMKAEDIHAARQATAREMEESTESAAPTGSGDASSSTSKRSRPMVPKPPDVFFDFEETDELTKFPSWSPSANDMPMIYERFCGEWNDGSFDVLLNAPPRERLRHLAPTRLGWWSFVGNPLAPRTAYAELKTVTLKCGDVNKSLWKAWEARCPFGSVNQPSPNTAVEEVCTFLQMRDQSLDMITKTTVVSTRDAAENSVLKQMACGEKGFWIVFDLVGAGYEHKRGTAVSAMVSGWHASSMYSVWRMLLLGPDFAFETKGNGNNPMVAGFYYHLKEQANLCAGYATYTPLSNSGFYFAPFFELRTAKDDPDGKAVSAGGSQQRVCQPHCTRFSRLLVHVLHMRDVFDGARSVQFNVNPGWVPTYEMDPDDSLAAFVQRCTDKQSMGVEIMYFRPELTPEQLKW